MAVSSFQDASGFAFTKTRNLKPSPVNLAYSSTKLEKGKCFWHLICVLFKIKILRIALSLSMEVTHELGEDFPVIPNLWTTSNQT